MLKRENKKHKRSVQVQGHRGGHHTEPVELLLRGRSFFTGHWTPINLGRLVTDMGSQYTGQPRKEDRGI